MGKKRTISDEERSNRQQYLLSRFRNIVGFGIATTAVLLVIDPTILPYTSPLFILAIWLIPAPAAFVPPIAGSEATWSAVEAKISREQGDL